MTLSALLVDDEPLALARLQDLLEDVPEVRVLGSCQDGLEALEALRSQKPDLLFLDIQMPELDGFDLLAALDPEQMPLVLFTTAYDRFALQAFQARAVDYLLKPFSLERLQESVLRARAILEGRRLLEERARVGQLLEDVASTRPRYRDRFVVRHEDRFLVIPARKVEAIEAEANYMWLHLGRDAYPFRSTLASLERSLDPARFQRVHRSWILGLDHLEALRASGHGTLLAQTRGGLGIPVSSACRRALEERLGARG